MNMKINYDSLLKPIQPVDIKLINRRHKLDALPSNQYIPSESFSINKVSEDVVSEGTSSASGVNESATGSDDSDSGDGDSDPDRRRPQHTHQYIYKSTPSYTLPNDGFVRLRHILQAIPISKSTWWAGVKTGRYPQPVRTLGQRITAWRVEDIRELIKNAA